MKAYLLRYIYFSHCQGTKDRSVDYTLVYASEDASFSNIRSRLMMQKHREYSYEIDVDSVENMTI